MQTVRSRRSRRFQLKIQYYANSYYIERIAALEKVLRQKPRLLQIEMIGVGEIPAGAALVLRSVLRQRAPGTRVSVNARSSLYGGSLLVWLLGDERTIRDDAKAFFRTPSLTAEDEVKEHEIWKGEKYRDSDSEIDPEDGDYARVLELINEFLPVREMGGRLISVAVLKEFGLVDSAMADRFLAAALSPETQSPGGDPKPLHSKRAPKRVAKPKLRQPSE